MSETAVDASAFLGMHGDDPGLRAACKELFVRRLADGVVMSLEQVGYCDDVVWGFPREVQDAYYPFMDTLHSEMPVRRLAYQDEDLRAALEWESLEGLPTAVRLTAAMAQRRGCTLVTVDKALLDRPDLPVERPAAVRGGQATFPEHLERLYERSLVLRVAAEAV